MTSDRYRRLVWLLRIEAVLGLLFAIFAGLLLAAFATDAATTSDDRSTEAAIAGLVGLVGCGLPAFALPWFSARRLRAGQGRWATSLYLVLLGMFLMPFTTLLAGYQAWLLFRDPPADEA